MPEFDILLITHNHFPLTANCVEAIYKNTAIPFRLTIIDDSTDFTPQYFRELAKDNLSYIRPDIPITRANQAWAIGFKNTELEYFVLMTNSTTVEPNWIDIALNVMKVHIDTGIIAFKILNPHGTIWHAGGLFNSQGLPIPIGNGEPGHRHTYITETKAAAGALMLVRRSAVNKELDDNTYIGWRGFEDTDFSLQLRQKGWKIIYCGMGSAYHIEGASSPPHDQKFWDEYFENQKRFLDRWQDSPLIK